MCVELPHSGQKGPAGLDRMHLLIGFSGGIGGGFGVGGRGTKCKYRLPAIVCFTLPFYGLVRSCVAIRLFALS